MGRSTGALKRAISYDGSAAAALFLDDKGRQLEVLLSQPVIDMWKLREFALSEGGLVNDSIRRRAWPALTGLYTAAAAAAPPTEVQEPTIAATTSTTTTDIPTSDFRQVELDVARCTWHLLTGNQRTQRLQMENKRNKRIAKVIKKKQARLATVIERTLVASTTTSAHKGRGRLHYYQGFHDVACIFLSVLRDGAPPRSWTLHSSSKTTTPALSLDLPSAVLLQVAESHFPDCMQQTFQPLQTTLLLTLFPLLAIFDRDVHDHLRHARMEPYFALPWVISWFSHEIRDTALVKRLFDVFVASHPLFPLYVCVAMLSHTYNKHHILNTDCDDFSALHQTLSSLPKHSSAVGWRYQPGTGYVSDHDDDESVTTEEDNESIQSNSSFRTERTEGTDGELVLLQAGILEKTVPRTKDYGATDTLSATSSISTAQITASVDDEGNSQVPFQELFDMALQYMHRVPPRRVLQLAQKYHGKSFVQGMMSQCHENDMLPTMLLHDPAPWALSPHAPSDVYLKARARKARGGLPPRASRNGNGNRGGGMNQERKKSTAHTKIEHSPDFEPTPQSLFLRILRKQKLCRRAAIATGMALSVQEAKRQKQRKRIVLIFISLLVAIIAWKFRTNTSATMSLHHPEEPRVDNAGVSKATCAEADGLNEETSCPAHTTEESIHPSETLDDKS